MSTRGKRFVKTTIEMTPKRRGRIILSLKGFDMMQKKYDSSNDEWDLMLYQNGEKKHTFSFRNEIEIDEAYNQCAKAFELVNLVEVGDYES